jgi:hypothetical protein
MNVLVEPHWIQKRGSSSEEFEDAVCPPERSEFDQANVRCAVADGATESIFARRWAEQLVFAVCHHELSLQRLSSGIPQLRANWREWLVGKTLPWYADEKARQGAFAALVAVELTENETTGPQQGDWHAVAVGDSCLFHIRGEDILVRFPIDKAESFDNRPVLICSLGTDETEVNEEYRSGKWTQGDLFYLMSDALACWFIKHIDAGGRPSDIPNHNSAGEIASFKDWVESLRDQGLIRNDDCTMLRVTIR